jgi:glycerophosphoryl diester phosphodiesterase
MFDPSVEPTVEELLGQAGAAPDLDLAAAYAPILYLDAREPFVPLAVGYTVFRRSIHSPSAHRYIELERRGKGAADTVIEYAIWWDWDITHLYELEHVWVYLDANGEVIHAEGSRHGRYRKMLAGGVPPLAGNRLTLFVEAGKHSVAPTRGSIEALAPFTRKLCLHHAGLEGVLVTWLFRGIIRAKSPEADRLVHTYLERYAFEPSLEFSRAYPIPARSLVPWPALFAWIPRRVTWWVFTLRQTIPPSRRRFFRIARRGASAYAPENTLAAIALAAQQGADLVQLDVQHSADGVPIIFHGPDLSRTTSGRGAPSDHPLSELKKLDAGKGEPIPTLEEAISSCREHHLGLYLQLESEAVLGPVVQAIQRHRLHDRVGVCSYHPEWLALVKALDPRIVTAVLLGSPAADPVAMARAAGAQYVHPAWEPQPGEAPAAPPADWVERVRAAGLGIICEHEGCLCDIPWLRQAGVDGICSGAPDQLLPRPG